MGLSARKLLDEYFSVEDIKAALASIGELLSGNKDELISRLIANWEKHNRKWYDLLEFLDTQTLRTLCTDYGLDSHGDRDTLSRRIRRADLLGTGQKEREVQAQTSYGKPLPSKESPSNFGSRIRSPFLLSFGLTVLVFLLLPVFGLSEMAAQLATAAAFFLVTWRSLRYLLART